MRYAAAVQAFVSRWLWIGVALASEMSGGCRRAGVASAPDGGRGAAPATSSGNLRSAPVTPTNSVAEPSAVPSALPPGDVLPAPAGSAVSFGAPGIARLEPPLPPFEQGMMDHADHAGWAADGSEFGYCATSGGSGATHCTFSKPSGKESHLSDFSRDSDEPDAAVTVQLERKIAGYVVRPTSWPYARDLVLTWEVLGARSPTRAESEAHAVAVLRVGARVRTAKQGAWPIRITAPEGGFTIHPEAIALSPDARALAVLGHEFGGEFTDRFELRFYDTRELASQAYNVGGLELQRAGAYAGAAEHFRAAVALEPNSPLPLYNLACALTRLGDALARATLELAIARGGAAIRQKVEHDPDFDSVRGGWLAEVLSRTNH
jgi:hypothetical protein